MWINIQKFEGGGWVIYKTRFKKMSGLEGVLVLALCLSLSSLIVGIYKSIQTSVFVEMNNFSTYYYKLGISYECRKLDFIHRVDQLTIGLVFINLNICFLKDIDA